MSPFFQCETQRPPLKCFVSRSQFSSVIENLEIAAEHDSSEQLRIGAGLIFYGCVLTLSGRSGHNWVRRVLGRVNCSEVLTRSLLPLTMTRRSFDHSLSRDTKPGRLDRLPS